MSGAGAEEDSFPELGSEVEDDDRELSGNSGSKKKYVYRRDVQRRYRERLKQKRQVTEVGLEQTQRNIALVTSSNVSLREIHNALKLLDDDGCRLLSILSAAQAQQVLGGPNSRLASEDPFDTADYFFQVAFSGNTTDFDDMLMKKYTSFPLHILRKKEQDFLDRLQGLMSDWAVCLSGRDRLEKSMASALLYRRRVAVFLSLYAPESHIALIKNVQPPPGNGIGDVAYQLLVSVVDGLDLSPEQINDINMALVEYRQAVSCVRTEMALAQLALCMTPGAVPPVEHELMGPSGGVPGVMCTRAQGFLASKESAVILRRVPYKLVHAYARLANAVLTPLSTVQNAKLILECKPYLPDHVQLCEIVNEMYSEPH